MVHDLKSLQRQRRPAKLLLDEPDGPAQAMGGYLLLRNSLDGTKRYQVTEAIEAFAPTRAGIHQPQALPIAQTADVHSQNALDFSPRISLRQLGWPRFELTSANDYAPSVNSCAASFGDNFAQGGRGREPGAVWGSRGCHYPNEDIGLRPTKGLLDFLGQESGMQHLDTTERLYLERQVTLARAIFVALSLVALLETSTGPMHRASVVFLWIYIAYFFAALIAALSERLFDESPLRLPLPLDFVILAVFLYLTPSVTAFWFLFLFAVFALATRGDTRAMLALVTLAPAGVIARLAVEYPFRWQSVWHWAAIGLGTLVSGLGMGFLGARERQYLERQQFLKRITGLLRFNRGLSESIRQALGELAAAFECEQACLATHDDELERLFVWRVNPSGHEARGPETPPLSRADAFLMDSLETSMCWEFKNGSGEGFGWDRRVGRLFRNVPPPAAGTREEFNAKSLLAVTIEASDHPVGRVILVNPKNRFKTGDLRWFEQIVRHLGRRSKTCFCCAVCGPGRSNQNAAVFPVTCTMVSCRPC